MTSLPGEQEENLGRKPKRDSTTVIIIIAISKYGRKSYDKQGREKCNLYVFNLFCVFFLFFLFLPDDKYCFKARDRPYRFRPESGDIGVAHCVVQRSVFGLTQYLLHSR